MMVWLFPCLCFSATYHVRKDGHDTNCSGLYDASDASTETNQCAFLTIQKGVNVATTAGDIVTVHTGDYTSEWVVITKASGASAESLITIQADPGDVVTTGYFRVKHSYLKINGFVIFQNIADITKNGFDIDQGLSYVQITNNTIRGSYPLNSNGRVGVSFGNTAGESTSSNFLISGNTFDAESVAVGSHTGANSATLTDSTQNWTPDSLIGLRITNINTEAYGTITDNDATTITATLSSGQWTTGNYYIVGNSLFICISLAGSSHTVSNNTFKNLGDCERIINIDGDNHIISGNEGYNGIASGISNVHPDIFQAVAGANIATMRDLLIENNYFHDLEACQIGINEKDIYKSSGLIMRNNIFANVGSNQQFGTTGMKIYNNTYYNVGAGVQDVISCSFGGEAATMDIKNNIFIGGSTNAAYGTLSFPSSVVTSNYNYVGTVAGGTRTHFYTDTEDRSEANGINGGDPKFVAPYTDCINNTCDFSLQSDSPLRDKGANLTGTVTMDYAGVGRPQGAGYDIGAYEYVTTSKFSLGSGPSFTFTGPGFTLN